MALLVTSCGFHLRGALALPPELHALYLDGNSPYSSLIRNIRKSLQSSHLTIVNDPKKAPVTLFIDNDNLTYSQSTIGTSKSMRNYNVTYAVTYELRNSAGQPIIAPKTVSASQILTTVSNEEIQNSSKLQETKNELIQNVIALMSYQISSPDTRKKLESSLRQSQTKKIAKENNPGMGL